MGNARSRFRSESFVECLLDEGRSAVRHDAVEAANLASLVPVAVHCMAGSVDPAWGLRVTYLSLAIRANALRIQGKLQEAGRLFQELRRRQRTHPALDTAALAETLGLEAALRYDQQRFEEAADLANRAILHHRLAENHTDLAKVMLLMGNIHTDLQNPDLARHWYQEAARLFDPEEEPFLANAAVVGQINVLYDQGLFDEAEALLQQHLDLFVDRDAYRYGLLRGLEGQIALGRHQWDVAEAALTECRDTYLQIGRYHDATTACLDIARAMLHQGKTAEVAQMASEVVEIFRAQGAQQGELSALSLVQEAAASQSLTLAILKETRKRLESQEV